MFVSTVSAWRPALPLKKYHEAHPRPILAKIVNVLQLDTA